MSCALYWLLLVCLIYPLAAKPTARGCNNEPQQLSLLLRSTANTIDSDDENVQLPSQSDLSQLSEQQLQELMQQLHVQSEFDEDHRGSSRPWKKVQRIIRRQLVRIPKRYLKKFLKQFGLARSSSSTSNFGSARNGMVQFLPLTDLQSQSQSQPQSQLYYLIPLE